MKAEGIDVCGFGAGERISKHARTYKKGCYRRIGGWLYQIHAERWHSGVAAGNCGEIRG